MTPDIAESRSGSVDERSGSGDKYVVVIGAGPAGLAAASAIKRAGVDPLVIDRAAKVAAAWRGRHDHLRLNTHRMFSHQPGAHIPRRSGPFPARDDYVAYLERYSDDLRVRLGTEVAKVGRGGERGELQLSDGRSITAAHVVIATGPDAQPVLPSWPGWRAFQAASSTPGSSGTSPTWLVRACWW